MLLAHCQAILYNVYMHISYFTHRDGLLTSTGFGYAGLNIVKSMQNLGHQVTFDDPGAEVQLMFTQPPYFKDHRGHNIGYTPWESTDVHEGWLEKIAMVESFWATSELNKAWYESLGVKVDYVFPHGVSDVWTHRKREPKKRIKFLHIGEPAPRKSGQLVFDSFIELFKNSEHTLTIKSNGPSSIRHDPHIAGVLQTPSDFKNVRLITDNITESEMVSLYLSHDVLVYPSWGEGFGFIPVQALATGMPVIFNSSWAPYKNYSVGLEVEDSLEPSPWPHMHPGKMLKPSKESVKRNMIDVVENFDKFAKKAYLQAGELKSEFSWERQASMAVEAMKR